MTGSGDGERVLGDRPVASTGAAQGDIASLAFDYFLTFRRRRSRCTVTGTVVITPEEPKDDHANVGCICLRWEDTGRAPVGPAGGGLRGGR